MARFVDPFTEFDRIFGGLQGRGTAMMPMDIYEQDGVYTLRFDLAGAEADNVDVTVENSLLTVTAVRPEEDTGGVNWLVRERPTGTHSRQRGSRRPRRSASHPAPRMPSVPAMPPSGITVEATPTMSNAWTLTSMAVIQVANA